MKIAGLDIGTTGCKLSVFNENGKYLDRVYQDYPLKRSNNEHEINVEVIWDKIIEIIQAMTRKYPDIMGIGVASFGETFVLTDNDGKPLHHAMLYTDPRGREECEELSQKIGNTRISAITGVKPHEMYSISKLMWMKKNKPDIYGRAEYAFLIADYVVYRLTGNAQTDYSLASRTMAFNITSLNWSNEILLTAGIKKELLPKPVPSGTSAGRILPKLSELTGLNKETIIVSIGHDQLAATVGAGVFDSREAAEGAGTVECIIPVYDKLPNLKTLYEGGYAVVPYVIPGKYIAYAFSYTGGALIQWCVDTLAKKEKELAKNEGISVNELLEGDYEDPTGILVLPHFAGAATPYMDIGSKGAILGLTTSSTVRDIYKACMEGVVYEMQINMEQLRKSGIHFEMMHATGGGAKSQVWMQMKADVLNIPITALETGDAGTVGSAMLTGVAVGCFENLEKAKVCMVEKQQVYKPNMEMHKKYMKIYERYKCVYDAVRPLVQGE